MPLLFQSGREAKRMNVLKIYCDSDTLLHNIKRHQTPKVQEELNALEKLLAHHKTGKIIMLRSRVNLREMEATKDPQDRQKLKGDYESMTPIAKDEKVLGSYSVPGGGTNVMVSDVQNETMRDELLQIGLERRDAEHLTQAICNHCDVFLTRDEKSIIRHRTKIEGRFPIKVRKPSELVAEI
jgi:hypothetical protein